MKNGKETSVRKYISFRGMMVNTIHCIFLYTLLTTGESRLHNRITYHTYLTCTEASIKRSIRVYCRTT